jgi:hypothetical protein
MTEVFPIVPASARTLWTLAVILLTLMPVLALLGTFAWTSQKTSFEASREGLRVRDPLYGRRLPLEALRLDEARTVDLGREPSLRPRRRTNGVGVPGYRAGWFRLQGGERALLFVTDPGRVLYLPTTQGFAVLLSAREPGALLDALRRAGSM